MTIMASGACMEKTRLRKSGDGLIATS